MVLTICATGIQRRENVLVMRSGPAGSCVVAAIDKYTRTTEILWRKRDCRPLSESETGPPRPLPGQAFIVFLGTLHQRWSSFTMHRFVLGGYLLQTTKEKMLINTSKDICKCKGKSGQTHYSPYLCGLAQTLGS